MKYFVKIENGLISGIYATRLEKITERENDMIYDYVELDSQKLNSDVVSSIKINKTKASEIEEYLKNPIKIENEADSETNQD